ncbi:hypothetical protein Gotur_014180 [Gossypium turneri]
MEKGFLDKVEVNVAIQIWSEKTQQEKGDKLTEGYMSELWDFTRINKHLLRALTQYWNSAYSCFTFGKVDLVPTVEEYTTLLHFPRIQADKAYSRAANVSTFLKRLIKKVSYRVFSENYSAPKEFVATPRSRQFIPTTQGLAQYEFAYKGDNYKKKVQEISNAWNQTHRMKIFAANLMTTPEYDWWWGKRVNDNVPMSSQENTRPIEEHLQVIPSEL